jgi:putative phosphoesterase
MKAALLGDVHGNLPALKAVLEHLHAQDAGVIWNIGDFVGYGPFPNQVVSYFRKQEILSIIGNYDQTVLNIYDKSTAWMGKRIPEKRTAFFWAAEHLSEKNKHYLASLPEQRRFQEEGNDILLVHGSPADIAEHLVPDTPDSRLRELADRTKADVIIFGHSHLPFARKVNGTWFINTGSVGRPDDGDPRACYAVLELTRERFSVTHFRVPYDVATTVKAIRRHELPEAFAQMFIQGVDIIKVLERQTVSQTVIEEPASRPSSQ